MSALRKPNCSLTYYPPRYLRKDNLIGNLSLIDEKNHQEWFSIIKKNYDIVSKTNFNWSFWDAEQYVIKQGWIPFNYPQLHAIRLLAIGSYVRPERLIELNIFINDGQSQAVRLKKQHRQPTSPYDFVLIDPNEWQQYEPLQRFYKYLPERPYCSNCKDSQAFILDKDKAMRLSYIQPNHPLFAQCLAFDVDNLKGRSAWTAWKDYNLPPPNIIVKNPIKDSCHYIYLLKIPVTNARDLTQRAVKHLDAIHKRMRVLLQADLSFCGSRIKNPFSAKHDTFVSGAEPYTLEQLAENLDLYTDVYWEEINAERAKDKERKKLSIDELHGYLGRNHAIFDKVRFIGYRNSHLSFNQLYKLLLAECQQYNAEYYSSDPLPHNELTHIARSITRFCKSSLFGQYNEKSTAKFSKLQAFRANRANAQGANSKGGQARSATYAPKRNLADEMSKQGLKNSVIAQTLNVTTKTLRNWGIFAKKS